LVLGTVVVVEARAVRLAARRMTRLLMVAGTGKKACGWHGMYFAREALDHSPPEREKHTHTNGSLKRASALGDRGTPTM
jgi:hypothetical protein